MLFLLVKHIEVYTFFIGNIIICHKLCNSFFKCNSVYNRIFVLVIEPSPIYTFHFFAVSNKSILYPIDDTAEIQK